MSTVNQDELKAIKVLKFAGKESEWDHWSEKFIALARARKTRKRSKKIKQFLDVSSVESWVIMQMNARMTRIQVAMTNMSLLP